MKEIVFDALTGLEYEREIDEAIDEQIEIWGPEISVEKTTEEQLKDLQASYEELQVTLDSLLTEVIPAMLELE